MSNYFDFGLEKTGDEGSNKVTDLYFDPDCAVFKGHYPGFPVFPASLLCDFCIDAIDEEHSDFWCIEEATFKAGIGPGSLVMLDQSEYLGSYQFTFRSDEEIFAELKISQLSAAPDLPVEVSSLTTILRPAALYLPQSYPLIAVDLVGIDQDMGAGVAEKLVSFGDYFFSNVPPADLGNATYPTGAVVEGIEQAAAIALGRIWDMDDESKIIKVAELRGVQIVGKAAPGQKISFYCKVTLQGDKLATLSGYAEVQGRPLVIIDKIYVVRLEADA